MTYTPQTTIEDKIRAKCPELMELSMGCKSIVDGKEWIHTGFEWRKVDMGDGEWGFCGDLSAMGMEILGHPIRLEHILKALGPKFGICGDFYFMQSTSHGWQPVYPEKRYDSTLPLQYDPSKQPLEQTPDCVQFLENNIK